MTLTAADVTDILRLLEASDFDQLDLEIGDLRLHLRRGENGTFEDAAASVPARSGEGDHAASPRGGGRPIASEQVSNLVAPEPSRGAHPQDAEPGTHSSPSFAGQGDRPEAGEAALGANVTPNGTVPIPSPMLGIFYRAPKPGADPFVQLGQAVEEDTIIGIVEVMKLMNSIRAGVRGEVVEIVARNAEMVEYGDPLLRVRPAG